MNSTGKITDYKIVGGNETGVVAAAVVRLIEQGWQPYGGLQVVCPVHEDSPAPGFYQAMVKQSGAA
jgi:hypothetical protein